MFLVSLSIVISVVFAGCNGEGLRICENEKNLSWKRDPRDCDVFYMCLAGVAMKHTCPVGYVVGESRNSCVPRGSQPDTCSVTTDGIKSLRTLDMDTCKIGTRTPDTHNCAKYYECTMTVGSQPTLQAKECLYPLLFDKDSGKCVHYSDVACGDRAAPKSPCEYDANQCRSSHCVPCHIRYPSCIGLPDGENFWAGREWTPYYIICHDERVVFTGECNMSDKAEIFNPDKKVCAEFEDKIFG